jgi:hypothetical protein
VNLPHLPGRRPRSCAFRVSQAFPGRAGCAPAFTLIELTVSAALMAMILVSAYLCLSACLASQKLIEPRLDIIQSARVAMGIMSADLRSACPLAKDFQFLGMQRMIGNVEADNLDFATHNYSPRQPRAGDYCQVSFFVEKDPGSDSFSLWRRRNPTIALDPLSGGSREEIARGVRGVRFEYYDGFEWYDTWGEIGANRKRENSLRDEPNLTGMPEAVRITLWFDTHTQSTNTISDGKNTTEPPLVFQTVARLNLAAASMRGSSSGGASDAADQTPAGGNN